MNKRVIVAALAASIASPAFAQSYTPSVGSGNIAPSISGPAEISTQGRNGSAAFGAYARVSQSVKPFTTTEKAWFDRATRPGY